MSRQTDKTNATPPTPPQQFSLLPKVINGSIAGIIGVSTIFPLDLVKTRLQKQTIGPNGEKQYKNMLDCFKKTYAAEGYFGMYRGSAVNILLVSPEKAIKLAANDYFRYMLTNKDGSLPIFSQMVAGALTGLCQIVVTTPMELLKIQMQDSGRISVKNKAESKTVNRPTALKLVKYLIKERGFFGLYTGMASTAIRDVSFGVIYFPLFAMLNILCPTEQAGAPPPFWWTFLSGYVAGSAAAVAVTPMDVVKTRMQTITKGSGERQYSSIMDCTLKTLKYEGASAFFKGGACRMMVIGPLFGIAQAVYYIGIGEYLLGLK